MRPLSPRTFFTVHRSTALLAACLPVLAACSRKDESSRLAPAASALAASTADPTAAVWHFAVDPTSVAHVELQGLKETIKGSATGAAGTLDVVPRDLAKSRGVVRVDLATFATHTFGTGDDATQTKHARTWLEVQVGDKTSEEMRWAELAIRSIDGLSAADLTTVVANRDGQDDVRALTMTVHGELLIHGHKVQGDDAVDVTLRYPPGAAADSKPTRMAIKSRQPMRVVLKELDIRPRDPAGVALAWTTNLIAKVADVADVTVDLTAAPTP
jgi:hypothetical protein